MVRNQVAVFAVIALHDNNPVVISVFGHCFVGAVVTDGAGESDEHPCFWVLVGWDGVCVCWLDVVVDFAGRGRIGGGGGVVVAGQWVLVAVEGSEGDMVRPEND
jgi:hypothetical protein